MLRKIATESIMHSTPIRNWPILLAVATMLTLLSFNSHSVEKKSKEKPTETPPAAATQMDNALLEGLLRRLDPNLKGQPGRWQLQYEKLEVMVITDENADRMRIISPIADLDKVEEAELYRMLQANFDSALDARYAIANNIVWSVYLHRLSSLNQEDFFSGMAQTLIVRKTFGTTYSSGVFIFKGGDSEVEQQKFYQDLLRKGNTI